MVAKQSCLLWPVIWLQRSKLDERCFETSVSLPRRDCKVFSVRVDHISVSFHSMCAADMEGGTEEWVKHKRVYVLHNSFKEICLFLSTWNAAVEQRGQLIHWWLECQRIYCKVLRHCNSAVNLLTWQDIAVKPAISVISNMSPPSPPPPPPPILTVIFESELACSLESAAISTNLT